VTRVTLVRVDTTMGAVCAAAGFGCLLNDNVFDGEVLNIDTLGVSVGFSVLQQAADEFNGFLRPATLCGLELLSLASPSNTSREPSEGNHALVIFDIAEVCIGLRQLHSRESGGHLAHILEMGAEILAMGARRFFGIGGKRGGGVAN